MPEAPRISPETLECLSRLNRLAENVWTLDGILRVVSYSGLLVADLLGKGKNGKPSAQSEFLLELFSKLTDARFVNRIIGLPGTLEGWFTAGDDSLSNIMAISMILYFPVEHLWWLSTLKPKFIRINSDSWSMWSCRFWTIYCVCDVLKTLKASGEVQKQIDKGNGKLSSRELRELKRKRMHLGIWLTCAASDLVMALQWSRPTPIVSDRIITLIGIYGGVAGLLLKWLKSR